MAKGRGGRGPTRMDKRREADAAEAREKDADVEAEEEEEEDEESDDEEGGSKKKKAAKKKPVKKPAAPKKATKRTRTPKEIRRRAVWVVFDNSNKPVGTFPFNQKEEAEEAMAKKIEEKKGTFFLNLIKEEIKD